MFKYILLHVQVVRGGHIHSSRPLVCLTFPLSGGLTPLSKPALTSYLPETFCAYVWVPETTGNQVAAQSKQRFVWCCVLAFPVQQDAHHSKIAHHPWGSLPLVNMAPLRSLLPCCSARNVCSNSTWVNSGYSCPHPKVPQVILRLAQTCIGAGWVMSDWHAPSFVRFWSLARERDAELDHRSVRLG